MEKPGTDIADAAPVLGRRARGKLEKRARIKEAALAVFREKGYDRATTREIADRADVAIATLFAYVRDKRDLLLMVVNDELEAISAAAAERIRPGDPLIDQLMEYYRPRFQFWGRDPDFSREAVRQVIGLIAETVDRGAEARRSLERRPRMIEQLIALLRAKQESGELPPHHDAEAVARILMAIYLAEQRVWLADPKPALRRGMAQLRRLFAIVLAGLGNAESKAGATRRGAC